MNSAHEIIKAVETITAGLKIETNHGVYSVVGVTKSTRMILGEDANGEIFKIYPMEVKSIQSQKTFVIKRDIKPTEEK